MQLFDGNNLKVDGPEEDLVVSNKYGQNEDLRTGKIFQPGNPVLVNRRFSDTYL